jgi:hypothetical protein
VVHAAFKVHKELGPGLLEKVCYYSPPVDNIINSKPVIPNDKKGFAVKSI